ncbi:MAG: Ni/Fe hydrogenase subunit alpha [Desulfurococcales archaeon ex4484_42]|nr:MAG: Ni/Fe hydrogenase subunit alpha [Desulfurococcales archaeon ex4484_42]
MGKEVEIKVNRLTRVEGEGALYIKVSEEGVERVEVKIFEPTRFFEAFLRGRKWYEVPDITARVCGICPIAYIMSSSRALEKILGIKVPEEITILRKIIYLGEWIFSHVLHVVFMHAPDFLGLRSAFELVEREPEIFRLALRIKKFSNKVMEVIGGRGIHPVSFRVGGLYRIIRKEELTKLQRNINEIKTYAEKLLRWTLRLNIPNYGRDIEFISLRNGKEYPILEGRVVSNKGLNISEDDFENYIDVEQTHYSNALRYRVKGRGPYVTGPIARFNNNYDLIRGEVRDIIEEFGYKAPLCNMFQSIIARSAEIYHAVLEIDRLIQEYKEPSKPYIECNIKEGEAAAITEAPRGILYHRYRTDRYGKVVEANLITPTAQNLASMEEDLRHIGRELLILEFNKAKSLAEQVIRNYDPCISCSVHSIVIVR